MSTTASESLERDESQEKAIDLICKRSGAGPRVGVITGGPGTGKTTCLKRALEALGPGCKVELAAPTGKAAKRMKQATGVDARTIHRLLEWKPFKGFSRNADAPIDADVIVVDEASMIDIELAAALFDAIGPRSRLVLVGDVNQLPPVGPGRPFADMIASGLVPVARLTKLHRSARESWVARNAPAVLRGEPLELGECRDFRYVHCEHAGEIMASVRAEVERLHALQLESQVLIPQSTGKAGTEVGNAELQGVFNPLPAGVRFEDAAYLPRKSGPIREGDRVIQTKNDYTLDVFNGDIGDVVSIEKGKVVVSMQDDKGPREVAYTLEQTNSLYLAYALTIHRSQGSEWPWIVCVVHSTHTFMLTRQLLYTAITRAREGVVIIGDDRGIKTALSVGRVPERNSTLIERMTGQLDEIEAQE